MELFFLILAIVITVFNSFTLRFQGATLYWGKKLQPDNELLPRGMQNAITPSFQNFRNIFLPISIILLMVLGLFFIKWYLALISGPVSFILCGFVSKILPKPESKYYYEKIHRVLMKKKRLFQKSNDSLRIEAVENVILLLNQIRPEL